MHIYLFLMPLLHGPGAHRKVLTSWSTDQCIQWDIFEQTKCYHCVYTWPLRRLRGDENGKTGVCSACYPGACMKFSVSCLISTCEFEYCKSIFRQPNTESPPKTCILQKPNVLAFCEVSLAFLPASDGVSASEWLGWCLLRLDDSAPQQKPWSPHSRWKRFLFCLSLAGKVRGRRASGIVAGQLGNCNGTWPNPFIFLSLSSRRVENLESWLGSIMAKWEKSPGACIWQGLAKRVSYLNDWLFTKFKRAKSRNQNASWNDFKYTSNPFLPQFDHLLGKSSWLESARHHCTSQVLELPEGGNAIMIYILT